MEPGLVLFCTERRLWNDVLTTVLIILMAHIHAAKLFDASVCDREAGGIWTLTQLDYPCSGSLLSKAAFVLRDIRFLWSFILHLRGPEMYLLSCVLVTMSWFALAMSSLYSPAIKVFYASRARVVLLVSTKFVCKAANIVALALWRDARPSSFCKWYLPLDGVVLLWQAYVAPVSAATQATIAAADAACTFCCCWLLSDRWPYSFSTGTVLAINLFLATASLWLADRWERSYRRDYDRALVSAQGATASEASVAAEELNGESAHPASAAAVFGKTGLLSDADGRGPSCCNCGCGTAIGAQGDTGAAAGSSPTGTGQLLGKLRLPRVGTMGLSQSAPPLQQKTERPAEAQAREQARQSDGRRSLESSECVSRPSSCPGNGSGCVAGSSCTGGQSCSCTSGSAGGGTSACGGLASSEESPQATLSMTRSLSHALPSFSNLSNCSTCGGGITSTAALTETGGSSSSGSRTPMSSSVTAQLTGRSPGQQQGLSAGRALSSVAVVSACAAGESCSQGGDGMRGSGPAAAVAGRPVVSAVRPRAKATVYGAAREVTGAEVVAADLLSGEGLPLGADGQPSPSPSEADMTVGEHHSCFSGVSGAMVAAAAARDFALDVPVMGPCQAAADCGVVSVTTPAAKAAPGGLSARRQLGRLVQDLVSRAEPGGSAGAVASAVGKSSQSPSVDQTFPASRCTSTCGMASSSIGASCCSLSRTSEARLCSYQSGGSVAAVAGAAGNSTTGASQRSTCYGQELGGSERGGGAADVESTRTRTSCVREACGKAAAFPTARHLLVSADCVLTHAQPPGTPEESTAEAQQHPQRQDNLAFSALSADTFSLPPASAVGLDATAQSPLLLALPAAGAAAFAAANAPAAAVAQAATPPVTGAAPTATPAAPPLLAAVPVLVGRNSRDSGPLADDTSSLSATAVTAASTAAGKPAAASPSGAAPPPVGRAPLSPVAGLGSARSAATDGSAIGINLLPPTALFATAAAEDLRMPRGFALARALAARGGSSALYDAPALHHTRCSIKLGGLSPADLPYGFVDRVASLLAAAGGAGSLAPGHPAAATAALAAVGVYVREGCVEVVADVLVPSNTAAAESVVMAVAANAVARNDGGRRGSGSGAAALEQILAVAEDVAAMAAPAAQVPPASAQQRSGASAFDSPQADRAAAEAMLDLLERSLLPQIQGAVSQQPSQGAMALATAGVGMQAAVGGVQVASWRAPQLEAMAAPSLQPRLPPLLPTPPPTIVCVMPCCVPISQPSADDTRDRRRQTVALTVAIAGVSAAPARLPRILVRHSGRCLAAVVRPCESPYVGCLAVTVEVAMAGLRPGLMFLEAASADADGHVAAPSLSLPWPVLIVGDGRVAAEVMQMQQQLEAAALLRALRADAELLQFMQLASGTVNPHHWGHQHPRHRQGQRHPSPLFQQHQLDGGTASLLLDFGMWFEAVSMADAAVIAAVAGSLPLPNAPATSAPATTAAAAVAAVPSPSLTPAAVIAAEPRPAAHAAIADRGAANADIMTVAAEKQEEEQQTEEDSGDDSSWESSEEQSSDETDREVVASHAASARDRGASLPPSQRSPRPRGSTSGSSSAASSSHPTHPCSVAPSAECPADGIDINDSEVQMMLLRGMQPEQELLEGSLDCAAEYEQLCRQGPALQSTSAGLGMRLLRFTVLRGWPAAATLLLRGLMTHCRLSFAEVRLLYPGLGGAGGGGAAAGMPLLHSAVMSGSLAMVRTVKAWAQRYRCQLPWDEPVAAAGGLTPLHLAAVQESGRLAGSILGLWPDAEAQWAVAKDRDGRTPQEYAYMRARSGSSGTSNHGKTLAGLTVPAAAAAAVAPGAQAVAAAAPSNGGTPAQLQGREQRPRQQRGPLGALTEGPLGSSEGWVRGHGLEEGSSEQVRAGQPRPQMAVAAGAAVPATGSGALSSGSNAGSQWPQGQRRLHLPPPDLLGCDGSSLVVPGVPGSVISGLYSAMATATNCQAVTFGRFDRTSDCGSMSVGPDSQWSHSTNATALMQYNHQPTGLLQELRSGALPIGPTGAQHDLNATLLSLANLPDAAASARASGSGCTGGASGSEATGGSTARPPGVVILGAEPSLQQHLLALQHVLQQQPSPPVPQMQQLLPQPQQQLQRSLSPQSQEHRQHQRTTSPSVRASFQLDMVGRKSPAAAAPPAAPPAPHAVQPQQHQHQQPLQLQELHEQPQLQQQQEAQQWLLQARQQGRHRTLPSDSSCGSMAVKAAGDRPIGAAPRQLPGSDDGTGSCTASVVVAGLTAAGSSIGDRSSPGAAGSTAGRGAPDGAPEQDWLEAMAWRDSASAEAMAPVLPVKGRADMTTGISNAVTPGGRPDAVHAEAAALPASRESAVSGASAAAAATGATSVACTGAAAPPASASKHHHGRQHRTVAAVITPAAPATPSHAHFRGVRLLAASLLGMGTSTMASIRMTSPPASLGSPSAAAAAAATASCSIQSTIASVNSTMSISTTAILRPAASGDVRICSNPRRAAFADEYAPASQPTIASRLSRLASVLPALRAARRCGTADANGVARLQRPAERKCVAAAASVEARPAVAAGVDLGCSVGDSLGALQWDAGQPNVEAAGGAADCDGGRAPDVDAQEQEQRRDEQQVPARLEDEQQRVEGREEEQLRQQGGQALPGRNINNKTSKKLGRPFGAATAGPAVVAAAAADGRKSVPSPTNHLMLTACLVALLAALLLRVALRLHGFLTLSA